MSGDRIESLEARRMLSAAVNAGVLTISGHTSVAIEIDSADPTRLDVQVASTHQYFPMAGLTQIRVTGTADSNHISGDAFTIPMYVEGGGGSDFIRGGAG